MQFHHPAALALICFLFLLCSLRPGLAHLRVLAHANAGDPVFRLLSSSRSSFFPARSRRSITCRQDSLLCRTLSAHPFLPRLSAGESLPRRFFLSRGRSRCALFRRTHHFCRRSVSVETNRAVKIWRAQIQTVLRSSAKLLPSSLRSSHRRRSILSQNSSEISARVVWSVCSSGKNGRRVWTAARLSIFYLKQNISARATGNARRFRRTSGIAASRSPDRLIARW